MLAPLCSWPEQPSPPTSPLRPDHALVLDFCRLLCGGREGRHHGWSGELGLDPLATHGTFHSAFWGRLLRTAGMPQVTWATPCVSSKSALAKYSPLTKSCTTCFYK